MAYKRNVEIFEEAYEKKEAKSVVSYVARDGRKRYIAGNKNPDGGGTPMPSGGGMTEVTWQELKDKRDNGELIPGSLYRITDYNCTTTQENTRSAGHQFDIVLLALSEDKLAEEGWAMMHEDIYDVICTDNVIVKCYYYAYYGEHEEERVNLVNVDTLLGYSGIQREYEGIINHETKTITFPVDSATVLSGLSEENLTYNYFQNSNLSAWKVWYCLDNDKSRFAWAMDIQPESAIFYIDGNNPVTRYQEGDLEEGGEHYYAWQTDTHSNFYTLNEKPSTRDDVYDSALDVSGNVVSYSPSNEGTGVIYRLIDEFNNDIAYDFKNIQFAVPLTDGVYDEDGGVPTFVYALTAFDEDKGNYVDISLSRAYECKIGYLYDERPQTYGLSVCVCFNNASQIEIGNNCFGIILDDCVGVSIGSYSSNIILTSIYVSSFGKGSQDIRDLTPDMNSLNYGNGGVELATKDDIGDIETALNNI